jgi:hypothetical protein
MGSMETERDLPSLINETPEASQWVEQTLPLRKNLGRLAAAVMWTDTYLQDGEPIGGNNPAALIEEINEQGLPLLRGHDPGLPLGRVVDARVFKSPAGTRFIAAIVVYYQPEQLATFASFGADHLSPVVVPTRLGVPNGARIVLAVDPRDVPEQWLNGVARDAPLSVQQVPSSYNAAESVKELIRIGLPYAALFWNPFSKTIAEQAGKDVYAALHGWLQKLWNRLNELRDPIVDVQANHNGCAVSFLLRGRDIEKHYAAHAAMPEAAAQAAKLIDTFALQSANLSTLFYEFEDGRWFPSYAILSDGRMVTDRSILIAYEQLPRYLSLGLFLKEQNDEEPENKQ